VSPFTCSCDAACQKGNHFVYGVLDYLTNFDALDRHSLTRVADALNRAASGLLRFEQDQPHAVASVLRPSPVSGGEARRLRHARQ
jgi:hypothetical protein